MKSLLEIQGVVVTAPAGDGRVAVLRDIDLSVKPGGVLGLVGESGAGKSMIGGTTGATSTRSGRGPATTRASAVRRRCASTTTGSIA
jgi:macrolide transport system ATP-binding/permease protein